MKNQTELLRNLINDLLIILFGGRLSETENKRMSQISGLESGMYTVSKHLRKFREFSKQCIFNVVAYGR